MEVQEKKGISTSAATVVEHELVASSNLVKAIFVGTGAVGYIITGLLLLQIVYCCADRESKFFRNWSACIVSYIQILLTVSLGRSTVGGFFRLLELSNFGSPPAEPGVYHGLIS